MGQASQGRPRPDPGGHPGAETGEQPELRRQRQEVGYLREQREILKKALGICSAQMPGSDSR